MRSPWYSVISQGANLTLIETDSPAGIEPCLGSTVNGELSDRRQLLILPVSNTTPIAVAGREPGNVASYNTITLVKAPLS